MSLTKKSSPPSKEVSGKVLSSIQIYSGKVVGKGSNTYTKSTKPRPVSTDNAEDIQQPRQINKTSQDFSQNFPTPRNTDTKTTENQPNSHNIEAISVSSISETSTSIASSEKYDPDKNRKFSKSKTPEKNTPKSFAYYLPLTNESPIKIGSRLIRERRSEGSLNKENRNIISNYISAIDALAKPCPKKKLKKIISEIPNTLSVNETPKSLQEALSENKPDFIKKSECRVEILRQIKDERCLYSEMRRNLLENIAKDAPKNQINKLPLTTVPKPKPRRLFDYKEMVKETRRKYEKLPEVLNAKYEARRTSSYRTNRLMADIYQRKLKDHVLKGKISLNHSFNIIT